MMRGVRGATTVEANDFRQMRDRVEIGRAHV